MATDPAELFELILGASWHADYNSLAIVDHFFGGKSWHCCVAMGAVDSAKDNRSDQGFSAISGWAQVRLLGNNGHTHDLGRS